VLFLSPDIMSSPGRKQTALEANADVKVSLHHNLGISKRQNIVYRVC